MLRVKVTRFAIEEARRRRVDGAWYWSPRDCAVAVAVAVAADATRDEVSCGVHEFCVNSKWYAIPDGVPDKIMAFDRRETIEPFEFVAPEMIEVDVTAEDIQAAKSNRDSNKDWDPLTECVVATSMRRQHPDRAISCGITTVTINGVEFHMPSNAQRLVFDFCDRRSLSPLRFKATEVLQ